MRTTSLDCLGDERAAEGWKGTGCCGAAHPSDGGCFTGRAEAAAHCPSDKGATGGRKSRGVAARSVTGPNVGCSAAGVRAAADCLSDN